jgi:hypothetical protein
VTDASPTSSTAPPPAVPSVGDIVFSDRFDALAAALAEAQARFTVAGKDKTANVPGKEGKAGFKYSYADLEAVAAACVPHLNAAGIAVLQPIEVQGQQVRATTYLMHKSGQWMRASLVLNAQSPAPQHIGSAASYGRRYGLAAMVGVVASDEDDDGGRAGGDDWRGEMDRPRTTSAPPRPAPPATDGPEAEAERLREAMREAPTKAKLDELAQKALKLPEDLRSGLRSTYEAALKRIGKPEAASNG